MAIHIALLRAVNVGGAGRLWMADLRAFFEGLGFESVQTLLQTGNVVFGGPARSAPKLENRLEAEAASALGFETSFFVRSAAEWSAIVRGNPFEDEARSEPGKLVVVCLKRAPSAQSVKSLQAKISGPEILRAKGKQAYIVYPDGMGRSRLTFAVIERELGSPGTARNWNTVLKLESASTP